MTLQIWAIDPDGSNPKALTALDQGIELAVHPAWSPDGSRLAFSGMKQGSLNVWVRNADGSLLQLTHTVSPISSMVPAWTADGKRIVFESNRAVPPAESTADDPYDVSANCSAMEGRGHNPCWPEASCIIQRAHCRQMLLAACMGTVFRMATISMASTSNVQRWHHAVHAKASSLNI